MWSLAVLVAVVAVSVVATYNIDPSQTLACHQRRLIQRVENTDSEGRTCWDYVSIMSCWGRCDSHEISDWKFPYKRTHHPVCIHDARELTVVKLANCDPDVEPGTERYEYLEALSCHCMVCKSSEASCEGMRYRSVHGG